MISVTDIAVRYGSTPVFSDVSLTCKRGEHLCIVGPNGSGKSTLLKAIIALVPLNDGTIEVDGLDPFESDQTRRVRAMVGYVQQRPDDQLVATSVLDEVAFGPENLGCDREEIKRRCTEALSLVGLNGLEERDPSSLSGGQKQRLVIAGALAMHPHYLLFDEPTSQLDPVGRAEILAIITQLSQSGVGIIHVTHDLDQTVHADTVFSMGDIDAVGSGTDEVSVQIGPRRFETASVLEARDVSMTYRSGDQIIEALHDRNLTVRQGELIVVTGHTGSGKSTLLKILSGLLRPTRGSVTLDGITVDDPDNRGRVGLIFQDAESALFADTVREDVAFGPRNFGASADEALRQADEALEAVGLDPALFGSRSPFHLSGGEARRAAIAGVLAFSPMFILADEPTAALDAKGRALVIKTLIEATAHSGVVVVTHRAEDFAAYASQVISLD